MLTLSIDAVDQLAKRHAVCRRDVFQCLLEGFLQADTRLVSPKHDRVFHDRRFHGLIPFGISLTLLTNHCCDTPNVRRGDCWASIHIANVVRVNWRPYAAVIEHSS